MEPCQEGFRLSLTQPLNRHCNLGCAICARTHLSGTKKIILSKDKNLQHKTMVQVQHPVLLIMKNELSKMSKFILGMDQYTKEFVLLEVRVIIIKVQLQLIFRIIQIQALLVAVQLVIIKTLIIFNICICYDDDNNNEKHFDSYSTMMLSSYIITNMVTKLIMIHL